jgi:phage tail-like protein
MSRVIKSGRFDPYRNFRFRVFWRDSEVPVAGFNNAALLRLSVAPGMERTITSVTRQQGLSGRTEYEAITLERGVTTDSEFAGWESAAARGAQGRTSYEAVTLERGITSDPEFAGWASASAGANLQQKRDLRIEIYNESGELMQCHRLWACRVGEFRALSELDARANEVTVEHLKLEHEGHAIDRTRANVRP